MQDFFPTVWNICVYLRDDQWTSTNITHITILTHQLTGPSYCSLPWTAPANQNRKNDLKNTVSTAWSSFGGICSESISMILWRNLVWRNIQVQSTHVSAHQKNWNRFAVYLRVKKQSLHAQSRNMFEGYSATNNYTFNFSMYCPNIINLHFNFSMYFSILIIICKIIWVRKKSFCLQDTWITFYDWRCWMNRIHHSLR